MYAQLHDQPPSAAEAGPGHAGGPRRGDREGARQGRRRALPLGGRPGPRGRAGPDRQRTRRSPSAAWQPAWRHPNGARPRRQAPSDLTAAPRRAPRPHGGNPPAGETAATPPPGETAATPPPPAAAAAGRPTAEPPAAPPSRSPPRGGPPSPPRPRARFRSPSSPFSSSASSWQALRLPASSPATDGDDGGSFSDRPADAAREPPAQGPRETIAAGDGPDGIAVDGTTVWVSNSRGGSAHQAQHQDQRAHRRAHPGRRQPRRGRGEERGRLGRQHRRRHRHPLARTGDRSSPSAPAPRASRSARSSSGSPTATTTASAASTSSSGAVCRRSASAGSRSASTPASSSSG